MESEACLVAAAVFKTVERLSWSLVGSIPSLSATSTLNRSGPNYVLTAADPDMLNRRRESSSSSVQ